MNSISRRLFVAGVTGAAVGLTACGEGEIERIMPTEIASKSSAASEKPGSNPRKWVHIGDSFTAISSVVKDLSNLTGYEHINAGVSGDTSINAALRTGAIESKITLENNLLKGAGEGSLVVDLSPVNFIARNSWEYPARCSGVDGYLINYTSSGLTYFERKVMGDEVEINPQSELLIDPDGETDFLRRGVNNAFSLIIGLGRNDIDLSRGVEELIENINKIINLNSDTGSRYLVWEIPPWSNEPLGSEARKKLELWNNMLHEAFGDYYVQPFTSMLSNPELTFDKAGISLTVQDQFDIGKGLIPTSFRKDSIGHLNDTGSRPWAYFMFQEMKKRGW